MTEETVNVVRYNGYDDIVGSFWHNQYPLFWPDGSPTSKMTKDMIDLKILNDETFWPEMRKILRHEIMRQPIKFFRSWAAIINIPLNGNLRCAEPLVSAVNNYHTAIEESWVGVPEINISPLKAFQDLNSSWQRCQNFFHLTTHNMTKKIRKLKSIVEIGGGYGDMSLLCRNLGFQGSYTIYDFPEIHTFQQYYLSQHGITETHLVTEPKNLEPADLVIATWSLSEMPMDLRGEIFERLKLSKEWLICYENMIFNLDNHAWFKEKFYDYKFTKVDCIFLQNANSVSILFVKP